MTEGGAERNAADVAAALTKVALALGGKWTIEVQEDGQLRLTEVPKKP